MTQTVTENTSKTDSQPTGPVVFFDGVCGLCSRFVNFVMPRDRGGRIQFAPLQGELASQVLPESDIQTLKTVVFWNGNQLTRESTAVVRILWNVGGLWAVVAALMWCIPWPIRDFAYALTAKHRYRMFGKADTCRLPTPEERARFLD